MGAGRYQSSICEYQVFITGLKEDLYNFRFSRSLITLYNVPTPIPTTQVTLNQHAGVLLFMEALCLGEYERDEEEWKGLDEPGLLDEIDDAWMMMSIRLKRGNRGGSGKCILGTCIRMKREQFKGCHPRLLVP